MTLNNKGILLNQCIVINKLGQVEAHETKEADGKFFISDNKFSKDRLLPVGPLHPEVAQMIDISGDKMKLVGEHTTWPEPHDAIIVRPSCLRQKLWGYMLEGSKQPEENQ